MAKDFAPWRFDVAACRQELEDFNRLLGDNDELPEREVILPFFRSHQHLAALVGTYNPNVTRLDLLAFEYDIFGDFAADLVIGDSQTKAYCFVEFEDATATSIFSRFGRRNAPDWSPRFEHGISQIIDWLWKLDDMRRTTDHEDRFDALEISPLMLLVIGRSASWGTRERRRWEWRSREVVVRSRHILCVTFDELAQFLSDKLQQAAAIHRAEP